jgi:serine/threonine protein kinase/Flp pilus assembly protein TadD
VPAASPEEVDHAPDSDPNRTVADAASPPCSPVDQTQVLDTPVNPDESRTVMDTEVGVCPDENRTLLADGDEPKPETKEDRTIVDSGGPATWTDDDHTIMESGQSGTSIEKGDGTIFDGANQPLESDATLIRTDARAAASDTENTLVSDVPGDVPTDAVGNFTSAETVPGDKNRAVKKAAPREKGPADHTRYKLVESVAQGGLGKIWKAQDDRIRREVAFKELLPNALKSKGLMERFLEEAQITGQLEHPGIVPIYDLGWQANGTPFYAMKLVRGVTYKKAIENCHALPRESPERHLAFVRLLRQFVDICNALAFAHNRGVIHRDLKPQNVMLGDFGETLVLDWGLAKIIGASENQIPMDDDESTSRTSVDSRTSGDTTIAHRGSVASNVRSAASQTVMGSIMGTPAYMPPEQAMGEVKELDGRSDVYSLGAMLYEVLTNKQPIAKAKITEMLRHVVEGKIVPPRSIDPKVPRALEAIVGRAMSLTKATRYATALDLAREVEQFLADEPVSAYPEPWPQRAKRWVRRHRTLVSTAASVIGIVIAVTIAWRSVESSRLSGIRHRVQDMLADAQQLVDKQDYSNSETLLREALVSARSEPTLSDVATDVTARLSNVQQLLAAREAKRLAELRAQAEQKHQQAVFLIDTKQDYQSAAQLLTESVTMLEGASTLEELQRTHRSKLESVQKVLDQQKGVTEARQRLRDFQQDVDRARFFGSQFTGDQLAFNARQAQKFALAALARYEVENQQNLDPPPAHLTELQVKGWRNNVFELAMILADAEATLARELPGAERRAGIERALDWLARTEQWGGQKSQAVWLMGAGYLRALGRENDAGQSELAATKVQPSNAWEFFLLAEIERRNNERYAAATVLYQQALDLDPEYFLALHFLGVCNLQRVQSLAAQEGDSSTDVSGYLNASITAFTTCLTLRPDFPWPLLLRGVAYASLQQYDRAFEDFERALKLADAAEVHDAELYRYGIHINRGAVSLQRERFAEAAADFSQALKLRPENPDPHLNLSEVHRRQKNYQPALVELTTAARLDPTSAKVLRFRGRIHALLEDDDAALKDYIRSSALDKSQKLAAADHYEVGRIHHRAGRLDQALVAYNQSLAADSTNTDVIRLRAEVLLALNQTPQAIAGFSDFLRLGKPVGDVYRARGLALAQTGNYRAAMDDYTRSLELEPDSPNILTRRGWAYLLKANQLALRDFDEAIQKNPENGDSYNGRGYARVLLGDYAAAVKDADEAVTRGPKAFEIYYNAATIFSQAVAQLARDQKLTDSQRQELRQRFIARAVELLREGAAVLGPQNRAVLLRTVNSDAALDAIRETPELKALIAP